ARACPLPRSSAPCSCRTRNTARPAPCWPRPRTSRIRPRSSKPSHGAMAPRHNPNILRSLMHQYEDFMRHVYEHGIAKTDRTGTGTRSVFGHQMRFDLAEGFPLITTKKLHTKSIFIELLWFLR